MCQRTELSLLQGDLLDGLRISFCASDSILVLTSRATEVLAPSLEAVLDRSLHVDGIRRGDFFGAADAGTVQSWIVLQCWRR